MSFICYKKNNCLKILGLQYYNMPFKMDKFQIKLKDKIAHSGGWNLKETN